MENTPTPNSDFEKLLRNQLEKLGATPDENTWAQIVDKQRPLNKWLRLQRYGTFAVPVVIVFIIAVAAWWHYQKANPAPMVEPSKGNHDTPTLPRKPGNTAPVAEVQDGFEKSSGGILPNNSFGGKLNTVPAATIHFQLETGLQYQSPVTGTIVRVPANSLMNANGQRVTGEAELLFREYRSIPDFLASGIPMHYADERGSFFFNSGGMFEVRVVRQGEPLQMMPGQTYDVVFSPTNQLTKASLYYLDDATGTWRFQPDPAFSAQDKQPPIATESEVVRNNAGQNKLNCLPELAEMLDNTNPAVLVKEAVLTGYELATGKTKMPVWFRKNPGLTNEQLLNGLERSLIRIVQHKDQAELFFPEDMNNMFTELAAFKDCYFTRTLDTLNGTKGMRHFNPNQYWQRIVVAQENGAYCQITLYSEQGWMQFFANLTGSTDNKNFDADKVMAEYRRLRTERQNNIESLVAQMRKFLFVAPAFQTEEEWCMAPSDWLNYFEENHPLMSRRYAALVDAGLTTNDSIASAVWKTWRARLRNLYFDKLERNTANTQNAKQNLVYALRLTEFGIYNCDQIFRLGKDKEPDYVFAGYKTPEGFRIIPASVSVMERSTRLFFTLPSADKMLRVPGRRLDIIVTDRNGRNYHLPAEKYAMQNLTDQRSCVFTVEDISDKTQTPRDWAELLEM